MKEKKREYFLRTAFYLGYLSSEDFEKLTKGMPRISRSHPQLTLAQYLIKARILSPMEIKKTLQLISTGYMYCSPCQRLLPLTSGKDSSSHCPQCKEKLKYYRPLARSSQMETQEPDQGKTPSYPHLKGPSEEGLRKEFQPHTPPPYRQLKLLGQGGFGSVYQVRDSLSGRTMALKIMSPHKQKNMLAKKRFLREIKITSILEHPGIMPVYESGYLEDGSLYFVMKEIRGGTLQDRLKREKKDWTEASLREVINLFLKICEALEYAHSKGVVHRDLKPANILLGDFGEVMIMDWGIAKCRGVEDLEGREEGGASGNVHAELTRAGAIMGTPGYLSPEQAEGKEVDHRSDIFSLGAILYQTLAGTLPFGGKAEERLVNTLMKKPLPPEKKSPHRNIPPELSAVAMKALARDREKRYENVRDLRKDLQRFLEGYSVSAKRDTFREKMWKWIQRNKALSLSMAASLVLILALGGGFYWWDTRRTEMEVEDYLDRAQEHFQKAVKAEDLQHRLAERKKKSLSRDLMKKREKSLRLYLQGKHELEKALQLRPRSRKIKEKLVEVQREIGLLALMGKNYMLSRLAFERCIQLGGKEGERLLEEVEAQQNRIRKENLERIEKIMASLGRKAPEGGVLDEYATEIAKMDGEAIVKKLLSYLKAENKWQKLLAIEALGKVGDTQTTWQGKDPVEWLVGELERVDLQKSFPRAVALVWALGRLGDERANQIVYNARWKAGQNSLFWEKTKVPFQWLPLEESQGESSLNPLTLNQKGLMFFNQKKYKQAIEIFNRLLREHPRREDGYNNRGMAYHELGRYKEALDDFNQAIKIKPELGTSHSNRGETLIQLGRYKEALKAFNQAIKHEPTNAQLFVNRGRLLIRFQKWERALKDFDKALQLDSTHPSAHIGRGQVWAGKKDYQRALAAYQRALELNPKQREALNRRGAIWYETGKLNRALEAFSEALRYYPQNAKIYNNRANVYTKLGQLDKALADYNEAIEIKGNYARALASRGKIWEKKKKYQKALNDYTEALKHDSQFVAVYYVRGKLLEKLKKYNRALSDYSKAISLYPRYAPPYKRRGLLYARAGQHQKAREDFRRYLKLNPRDSQAGAIKKYMNKHQ